MGACFARVQLIAAQEEYIAAQDMHIQELHERLVQLEEVNETRWRELCKTRDKNILLKQLMSNVSN